MATNLPASTISDSAEPTKYFFDQYGDVPLTFPANDVDSTVSFFKGKGFADDAAVSTALVILKQARSDGISVFVVLDTLKGFNQLELSSVVAEILNNDRRPISVLGYRARNISKNEIERNVFA